MTAVSRPAPRRRLYLSLRPSLLLLAVLGFLVSGCSGLYLNPGPQAARLVVPVKGKVTPAQREMAAAPYGGLSWSNFPPQYNVFSEPLWDAQAFIIAPDGGYHQLPPAPGTALHEVEGYAVDTVAQFLIPPGQHKIRVLFTCSVRRTYQDREVGEVHEYIYLLARELILDVSLPPNGSITIEGFTSP